LRRIAAESGARQHRQVRGEIACLADESPGLRAAAAEDGAVAAVAEAVAVAGLAAAPAPGQAERIAQPLRRAAGEWGCASG
jgi:hypothetical protein